MNTAELRKEKAPVGADDVKRDQVATESMEATPGFWRGLTTMRGYGDERLRAVLAQ